VDGQDFLIWNDHKFTSVDGLSAVPEPCTAMLSLVALVLLGAARRR
jgi:MYXO-CTERM domain-containing protein